MEYNNIREIKIKIIEALQEWAEEYGLETSGEMEANGAERIFNRLDGKFKEK